MQRQLSICIISMTCKQNILKDFASAYDFHQVDQIMQIIVFGSKIKNPTMYKKIMVGEGTCSDMTNPFFFLGSGVLFKACLILRPLEFLYC